jgi:septum formation protein
MTGHSPKLILASRSPRRRELLAAAGYEFEVCPPSDAAECGECRGETPSQLVARLAYQKAADVAGRLQAGFVVPPLSGNPDNRGIGGADIPVYQKSNDYPGRQECLPHFHEKCLPHPFEKIWLVLGCDTVVECAGQILGKPIDEKHAREILTALSGNEHRVFSGLCLWPVLEQKGTEEVVGTKPCIMEGDSRQPPPSPLPSSWGGSSTATPTWLWPIPNGEPVVRVAESRLLMDKLAPRQLDEYLAGDQWKGKAGAFGYQDGLDWVHLLEGSESNVVGLPMELLEAMLMQYGKK